MNFSLKLLDPKHRGHVAARAVVCCLLLALPACRIPCLRKEEPAPPLPADYTVPAAQAGSVPLGAVAGGLGVATSAAPAPASTSENSADLGVDEFFGDPLLTRLIQQALVGNRELKMLDEEVQVARNEILARRGAYLPFVTLGGRVGLDKPSLYTPIGAAEDQLLYPPGRRFPDPLGDFMGAFNFYWTPDIFGALHNAQYAAERRYLAATERRNTFVTRLIADTADNYFRLMALDKRIEMLNLTIALQQQSYELAVARKEAGRGTELAVQRFAAEVRKNQSEKLIVRQDIIETENRINFLVNRYPEPVERSSADFFELTLRALSVGFPAQLLQNRPDIRQAEYELAAAGLDVRVARARFLPAGVISSSVGYQAFNLKYLFVTPDALIANVAAELVGPLINKAAIRADYLTANARQLAAVYNYQRTVLNAYTEVYNRVTMAENYRKSVVLRKQQIEALEASVDVATKLFQNARAEYVEVLLAQRDLLDGRVALIDTKQQQLSAVVNAYQALGGGASVSQRAYAPNDQFVSGSTSIFNYRPDYLRPLDMLRKCLKRVNGTPRAPAEQRVVVEQVPVAQAPVPAAPAALPQLPVPLPQ